MDGRKSPIYFYAFDLLPLDGKNLVSLPLEVRKTALESLCAGAGDPIRYSAAIGGDDDASCVSSLPQSIRQHTCTIRQHMSAYMSMSQHTATIK